MRFGFSKQVPMIICSVGLCLTGSSVFAQEHPQEHPKKANQKEHPEHPKKDDKSTITKEALSAAIKSYVENDAKLKGGYFMVYDSVARKPLPLALERVHEDRLSSLGDGVYFACADFKSADGRIYDLDVFMKQTELGLHTTEVSIHKEAGRPRYNWQEKDGIWHQVKTQE